MRLIRQKNGGSCLRNGVGIALAGSVLAAVPLMAQQGTEPQEMKPTVVTGSYIPTAETVGVVPVDTVSAATIEKIGAQDTLDLLKKINPSFSGNGNVGQEVNNGGFGESYVAIRNLPTLVLVNGRRLGNSSFSNGALVDLNTIPLAAIERVEVLKDGASALYGSEAVGGVVNIITKQNYSGLEIGGRYGFATREGDFAEQRATLVGGTATETASISVAAQWYKRDGLKTTDRDYVAGLDYAELEAKGIDGTSPSYMSPSFPGKYSDTSGAYVLRSHPLLQEFDPGSYDPSAPLSPPRIPDGNGGFKVFGGSTAIQDYINDPYWAANNMQAPLIADPGLWLNTTKAGTHTIQEQERRNFLGSGEYKLFEDRMVLFADFLFADINSLGSLAPSPVIGLATKQSNINIPAGNIYNFFGIDLGPAAGASGLPPGGPRVRSRFVDSGNRLFDARSDYYHFTGGLKGDLDGGWGYNAAYNYNKYNQVQYTRNAVNGAALDLALQPNMNPVLAAQGYSALPGPTGAPVPQYNIFGSPAGSVFGGPLVNSQDTIDAISTTLFQAGESEEWDAGGVITGTPLDLPGGKLGFAAGGGYGAETLVTDYDGLTRLGKVPGLNASGPTGGTRYNYNLFAEVRLPITSPDMDVPVLHSLELTAAGRYENFDPGGDSAVPKVGLRLQPLDEQITIRGSYGQSFVAPTTYQLFGGDQVSVPAVQLPRTSAGGLTVLQEYTNWKSNAELEPADAENYGVGIVISPKAIKNLTVSVDYYHVKYENQVFRMGVQTMTDSLNALGSASPFRQYFYKADGSQITTTAPNQANDQDWGVLELPLENGAEIETDGFDITANYMLETENSGVFNFYAAANVLLSYEYSDPIAGGPYEYGGYYSDPSTIADGGQGTLPDYQINTGMSWDFKDFTLAVNARYVPEVEAWGSEFFTTDGSSWTTDSWYSIDLQLAYRFTERYGKLLNGTRVAVGANNVTDNDAPLIASAFEDNTDKATYDIIGRFIYFEISKRF